MNTVSANVLHRKRSTARYGNTLFSYLAVDLYDKHAKCAYLQAEKHPIFVLEHKHTLHREGMAYQAAIQPQSKAPFSQTSTTSLLLPIPAFPGTGNLVGDFTGDFTVALSIADTGKVH